MTHPGNRDRGPWLFLTATLMIVACGCDGRPRAGVSAGGQVPPAVAELMVLGKPGFADGSLHEPRGVETLGDGACLVVDRSGRIQRFAADGTVAAVWWLPEWKAGQPIDLTRTPWGTVLVADTHYQRLLEYDLDGRELRRLGGPEWLALVRGVAVGDDDVIYVADYGGVDRVHRFARDGTHLGSFGSTGSGPGQFLRPEGVTVGASGDVYVVDCGNHRVQRFAPDGRFLGSFGGSGDEPGRFLFPFDIATGGDGTLYVVDYRGNRVQRFTAGGELLGVAGGAGGAPGRFATPRGVAIESTGRGDLVFVADTYNHRVQRFRWRYDR